MNNFKNNSVMGFTLIELLMVIAIICITTSIAVPSFQSLIASNRLTTWSNNLLTAMQLAKSESIKTNRLVIVSNIYSDWKNGWVVFADNDRSRDQGSAEPTISAFEAIKTGYTVKIETSVSSITSVNSITYRPDGRIAVNASYRVYFCTPANLADFRSVFIEPTGRVRVETPKTESKTYATACG